MDVSRSHHAPPDDPEPTHFKRRRWFCWFAIAWRARNRSSGILRIRNVPDSNRSQTSPDKLGTIPTAQIIVARVARPLIYQGLHRLVLVRRRMNCNSLGVSPGWCVGSLSTCPGTSQPKGNEGHARLDSTMLVVFTPIPTWPYRPHPRAIK